MYLTKEILEKCTFLYGAEPKYVDVTDIIKKSLDLNTLQITNDLFKMDPVPRVLKHLKIINYENNPIYIKENDYIYIDYSDVSNLIRANNISEVTTTINHFKNIKIFGKGPTFKNILRETNSFHIAVNQAANILDDVDMLVINDLHNIFKITPETFKKLKFILTPFFLNVDCVFNEKGHWKNAYDYAIKNGFIGKYIIYNLSFSPPNNNIITLDTAITSAHTGIEFICKFCDINIIYTYGIANGLNYGNGFVGNGNYNKNRIQYIYNHLINLKKIYNKNIIIN